jgi:ribose 5-phosphate isomerase A
VARATGDGREIVMMARSPQSMDADAGLEVLAARALELTSEATVIGLGSGRAAWAFVRTLGQSVKRGRTVRAVPASEETARLAAEAGIPLTDLEEAMIDVTVDGADEVDPQLDLIKGYGGALVRERILAAASRRQLILVGVEKLVPVLGSRGRLPVEVIPFALPLVRRRLRELGCEPELRTVEREPVVSDNGNLIVDCAIGAIADPRGLDGRLRAIAGVVDAGLFLGTADTVLVGDGDEVRELRRRP